MSFEPRDYLRHIMVEADYLMAQTAGLNLDEFVANETLRRAFVARFDRVQADERGHAGNEHLAAATQNGHAHRLSLQMLERLQV
jgi:hypothetical protein